MNNNIHILIVEDDDSQRGVLKGYLQKKEFHIFETGKPEAALEIVKNNRIDIILSDLRMPGMAGDQLMREVKALNPEIIFLIMTAYGSVESAVQSIKDGAFDFLTKPVNLDHLLNKIKQMVRFISLEEENRTLKNKLHTEIDFQSVIGESKKIKEVLSLAARVAESSANVLILGESGTGKELIARAIHLASGRKDYPFIAVNCAALAEGVLESELFGHEKGAFTGAASQRLGRFEQAHKGTLFLDEVGDIPASIQVKLLRVIQEGAFERVGGNETIKTDVRLIAATHRDLEERIAENRFREDLFYRLNVVQITIPPLRSRKEDLPLLIDHFLEDYSKSYNRERLQLSSTAKDLLMKYHFPGNVRELQNIIERAVVLSRGSLIEAEDLNLSGNDREAEEPDLSGEDLETKITALERTEIIKALETGNGNQSEAARQLGISERKLRYKMDKYQIFYNRK